jgi:ketosteroid isomerase-like protein
VPDGILRGGYEALERGDAGPLLALLSSDLEWVEPELEGYPLSGVHRGRDAFAVDVLAVLAELFDGLTFAVDSVVAAGAREVVCGVMRGRVAGASSEWEMPFAHVWEVDPDARLAVRGTAYFDRSRLTLAASRRALADAADDLLEQAAEIRTQWARLGDALRAAGVEDALPDAEPSASGSPAAASARLVAVDMASEGASRAEVDAYLREELGLEDTEAILDEAFDPRLFAR